MTTEPPNSLEPDEEPIRTDAASPDSTRIENEDPEPKTFCENEESTATAETYVEQDSDSFAEFLDNCEYLDLGPDRSQLEDSDSYEGTHVQPLSVSPDPSTPSKAVRINSIGRYKVQTLLGQGGYGRVYKAVDSQLNRLVAVKVSKMQSKKGAVDRFLREARSAAHLRHPAIVPVYEFGQTDELSMIVYELIRGETLGKRMQRSPIELTDTVTIIRKVAEGLDYAHRQGIVHRDIKPENILLDQEGDPHIADFGCSRRFDDQDLNSTVDGSILGTPSYMSPEQASGRANQADGRTDVWSLGVMLYEMTSGHRPFKGNLMELLDGIQNQDPVALRKLDSQIPRDIETICHRCLQRDPRQRFQSAGMLAEELNRFERGIPIQSRRINILFRGWLWAKRNPLVASLLTAVVAILIFATTISTYFWTTAVREQNQRAQESLRVLTTADSQELTLILSNLTLSARNMVDKICDQLDKTPNEHKKRRLLLGLNYLSLDLDDHHLSSINDLILKSDSNEIIAFANGFSTSEKEQFATELWKKLEPDSELVDRERLAAICLLAQIDSRSERWGTSPVAADAAGYLTSVNLLEIKPWLYTIMPLQKTTDKFEKEVTRYFLKGEPSNKESAALILSTLYEHQPEKIVKRLLPHASSRQLYHLLPLLSSDSNRDLTITAIADRLNNPILGHIEKANLVVAKIHSRSDKEVWQNQLREGDCQRLNLNNTVGTEVIERLGPAGTNVDTLIQKIEELAQIGLDSKGTYNDIRIGCSDHWNALAVVILALGQFNESQIPESRKNALWADPFESVFRNHPDARVHSAVRWLFKKWGLDENIDLVERQLIRKLPDANKNWHVDNSQNTFVIFEPGQEFSKGNDWPETASHRFGICIYEVSCDQFIEYTQATNFIRHVYESSNLPITEVQYFWALAYCQWLTEKFMNRDDSAFKVKLLEQNNYDLYQHLLGKIGKPEKGIDERRDHEKDRISNDWFDLNNPGYRLPTKSEWQFACSARASTIRSFGEVNDRLGSYAWYTSNSDDRAHPVGMLKPNEVGLFDMLGNVAEWCLDVSPSGQRLYCGGHFQTFPQDLNTNTEFEQAGIKFAKNLGFRLARSYPLENPSPDQ